MFSKRTLIRKRVWLPIVILMSLILAATLVIGIRETLMSHKRHVRSLVKNPQWVTQSLDLEKPSLVKSFGPSGFALISNLIFDGSAFYLNCEESRLTSPPYIKHSAASYIYPLTALTDHKIDKRKRNLKIVGTSLIFQASASMEPLQDHYFHFCEEFIAALAVQKHFDLEAIQTIIFPVIENWKGPYHNINEKIIRAVCPNAQVYGKKEFDQIAKRYNLQFENAIYIDRVTSHCIDEIQYFNKMLFAIKEDIPKSLIQELSSAVHTHLKTYDYLHRKPYITYIKRDKRRYLEPGFEKRLLEELSAQFPEYTLKVAYFERLSFQEQLQLIRNTKILIGAHGNGLTHQLFLPSKSLVIELFPKGAFAMDYQLFAELKSHDYYALSPEQGIISKTGNYMPMRGNLNQVIDALDMVSILRLIQEFNSKELQDSKETSFSP